MFSIKLATFLAVFLLLHITTLECAKPLSRQFANCSEEQYRLQYHFSPAQHWSNDPNGMVYYDGTYHLFFQHNPFDIVWGPMHWGHAISEDMASWTEVDIALYPDELGTIFSGSAVVDFTNSTGFQTDPLVAPIIAMFTHDGDQQRQSIAYSTDKATTFTKYPGNPVIDNPGIRDFRDPKVRRFEDKWVMVLAVWNRIDFFESWDLKSWNKTSDFGADPEEGSHGGTWECPDLFPLTVQHDNGTETELWVLIVSMGGGGPNRGSATQYFVGNFDGRTFTSFGWQDTQWADWGPDNYAGVTFSNDPSSRVVSMGWMSNLGYSGATPTGGAWRGQFTLPRQFGLVPLNDSASQYRLTSTPVEELGNLRDPLQYHENLASQDLMRNERLALLENATFETPLMEIEITFEIGGQPHFAVCAHNSIEEEVCFSYNEQAWHLDRSKTGNIAFNPEYGQTLQARAVREVTSSEITMRLFLDTTSAEMFADGGLTTMTSLFFTNQALDQLYVENRSGNDDMVRVLGYKVWGLQCWHPGSGN